MDSVAREASDRAGLSTQAAAVAAQQAALVDEEARLCQRRVALERQEQQLAAHLEQKRKEVLRLGAETTEKQATLERNRLDQENQFKGLAADLKQAQCDISVRREKIEADRQRLIRLGRRLRRRWQRAWQAARTTLTQREADLCAEERSLALWAERLEAQANVLIEKRLRFGGLFELGRRQLTDAWTRLRQEQWRWKHRRGKERAALKVRSQDIDTAANQLAEAQRCFRLETQAWDKGKGQLEQELANLDARVRNQREILARQQAESARLEAEIRTRREMMDHLRSVEDQAVAELLKEETQPPAITIACTVPSIMVSGLDALQASQAPPDFRCERGSELEVVAAKLADQRWQLVETWQRLASLHLYWQREQAQADRSLDEAARHIVEKGRALVLREESNQYFEEQLRREQQTLLVLRNHVTAWRSRLKVREIAWESDRRVLVETARLRDTQMDRHLRLLDELRQRWLTVRRQEVQKLRHERAALETLRREADVLKLRLAEESIELQEERRGVAAKAIALTQFRQELLSKNPNPAAAERRIERLRRRWVTHNAAILRSIAMARETLRHEQAGLETVYVDLNRRSDLVATAEADLADRQAAWEFQVERSSMSQERLQLALDYAEKRRRHADEQLLVVRAEIERMACSLLEEPAEMAQDLAA